MRHINQISVLPAKTHLSNVSSHQRLHQVQQSPLQVGVSSDHHGQRFLDGKTDIRLLLETTMEFGNINIRYIVVLFLELKRRKLTLLNYLDRDLYRCLTYLAHGLKKLLNQCDVLCEQLWHAARGERQNADLHFISKSYTKLAM